MTRIEPCSTTSLAYWGWGRALLIDEVWTGGELIEGELIDGELIDGESIGGVLIDGLLIGGVLIDGAVTDAALVDSVLEEEAAVEYGETCCANPFVFVFPIP